MSDILILEKAEKIYSALTPLEVKALSDVSFSLAESSFTYLLGPSGSGKTTLLNLAGLLDSSTSGKVIISGKDTSLMTEKEKAKLRNTSVGFVFQQPTFLPEFTASENVMMPSLIAGADKKTVYEKAKNFFDTMGVGERAQHYPSQLSGGELQRFAILRALMNDPSLLLCDEPTGQLDDGNAALVMKAMTLFLEMSSAAVLFVTHNRDLAAASGRRVLHLRNGVLQDGDRG
ncbi:MAG: lipoprotein-releasing system ATP-binding protein LolD [Elusimicrobia bacterium HGW-Elusimicrobia-2]|nr:MAG: lipoprotein-releasing system ATP-binding protein LolD [Elusimicrobia bacterium HGW-Elusimicrobia-2]